MLEEAQAIMAEHQLQLLPFVDEDGKLVSPSDCSTCPLLSNRNLCAFLQHTVQSAEA